MCLSRACETDNIDCHPPLQRVPQNVRCTDHNPLLQRFPLCDGQDALIRKSHV